MKKYGVDQTGYSKTKTADPSEDTPKCPECEKPTEDDSNSLVCPTHGTKPFEVKKDGKEED